MESKAAVEALAALAHDTRLSVYRLLVEAGPEGKSAGAIGEVNAVHVWSDHPVYPCALVRPAEEPPPPDGMDWDLWLGPRQERPFHPAYFPVAWRDFWDFGCTGIGDFACHDLRPLKRRQSQENR